MAKYMIVVREKPKYKTWEQGTFLFYPRKPGDTMNGLMKKCKPNPRMDMVIKNYLDDHLIEKFKMPITLEELDGREINQMTPLDFYRKFSTLSICETPDSRLPFIYYSKRDAWNEMIHDHLTNPENQVLTFMVVKFIAFEDIF